ncbi:MAG TPA: amidase, partial [Burkholderiaceae bacterium]|nr:amidase [Burkholderiaceae bacterium]
MTDDSFDAPTISERVAALRTGRAHAVALIDEARERAQRDAALNAIAWADWEAARAEAAERDREAAAGRLRGPLHGMPVSIKDLYQMRGTTMRAGTQAPLPAFDRDEAVAVGRLRDAGAILFAKTNLVEVALGATGENPWTGDVRNPWDPALQSGGSSSGAGVCVARGIGVAGLGSDTGGSIRVPANFCGVVGFKPTFGAVPLAGALHLSWTID